MSVGGSPAGPSANRAGTRRTQVRTPHDEKAMDT